MFATKAVPTNGYRISIIVSSCNLQSSPVSVRLIVFPSSPENPCKLLCTDFDDTIIANWGETVQDGTNCGVGTNNMCIDGICKVGPLQLRSEETSFRSYCGYIIYLVLESRM